jgi:hypothetical protein
MPPKHTVLYIEGLEEFYSSQFWVVLSGAVANNARPLGRASRQVYNPFSFSLHLIIRELSALITVRKYPRHERGDMR